MTDMFVWLDEAADGPSNMATDDVLAAEAARHQRPLLRFYRWNRTTFSLGGFQSLARARAEPLIAALPFVRRPSGGGGIIHGSDITYAVAVPRSHPWGGRPQVLYDAFHEALATVLNTRGIPARLHGGRGPGEGDDTRLFCFERRARGDVIVPGPTDDGSKILGSAQRRLSAAVLQHGSLLLDTPRWDGSSAGYPGLADVFSNARHWSPEAIIEDWLAELSSRTGLRRTVMDGQFAVGHEPDIANAAARFHDPEWLARR